MSLETFSSPTQNTAPVAGTAAGKWTFGTPVNQISIDNNTGARIYVLFNNNATGASASVYDIALNATNGTCTNTLAGLGLNTVTQVSVWVASSGDVDLLNIRGLKETDNNAVKA